MASRRNRSRFRFDEEDLGETSRKGSRSRAEADRRERGSPDQVDLHGCTVEGAKRLVSLTLTRCRAGRRSPLIVVTGRGFGSHGGNGVLKPAMLAWLRGDEARALGAGQVREIRSGGALEVSVLRGDRG